MGVGGACRMNIQDSAGWGESDTFFCHQKSWCLASPEKVAQRDGGGGGGLDSDTFTNICQKFIMM